MLGSNGLAQSIEEGAYLTAAAGCKACHTQPKGAGQEYAGGRALDTPFGTFYTPNITFDPDTGIGRWSDADFVKALKKGISPEGFHYFPAFPYTSYTNMTDRDARSIYAYLKSLPPVQAPNKPHDIGAPFSWRWLQWGWKILFFKEGGSSVPVIQSSADRGNYLVNALGHCGECHTPRNALGGIDRDLYLAGSASGGEGELVPNITPDKETGIGDWSKLDMVSFLETGMKPNFDDVQGTMEDVITHGTSKLTKEDRTAIADFLFSVAPVKNKVKK
ncbi:c-type cytochrome [Sneathiella aquimaris]|uniref:c-type cytochrome n=1 Tax=Sneathiella aquimaris TaxID=2599305 RepID=UPI001C681D0D|nr:cytochrome c [Sneathiella aquimaris]